MRDLITAVDVAATLALGGPTNGDGPAPDDRLVHASDVLAALD